MARTAKGYSAPARYPAHTDLRERLNRAVDQYFRTKGVRREGGQRLWWKTATIIAWAVGSWVALVFFTFAWWQALLAGASLGLAVAGIGFNVMHDGGHGAFSKRKWANRWMARVLDLIGGSSYHWNWKHNILHHQYTNVDGVDEDLEAEPFLRLAPRQKRRFYHRLQHLYVWGLLAFFYPKWQFVDDFRALIRGKIGKQSIPRPRGFQLTWMLIGKTVFFAWALIVPLVMHSWWEVLLVYAFVCSVTGITIGVVFQLAHCVEEAAITPRPNEATPMPTAWAEHQLATTADFAPRNPLLTWYLGGLNFQVEHHLFPRVSHVHYPKIAEVVQGVCRENGVPHHTHRTLFGAFRSHIRFLRRMGRED